MCNLKASVILEVNNGYYDLRAADFVSCMDCSHSRDDFNQNRVQPRDLVFSSSGDSVKHSTTAHFGGEGQSRVSFGILRLFHPLNYTRSGFE